MWGRATRIAIAILGFAAAASAQQRAPACSIHENTLLSARWPFGQVDHEVFTANRYSAAVIRFQNLTSKPIVELRMLVDYREPSGRTVLTIPFGLVSKARYKKMTPIPAEYAVRIHDPVAPMEAVKLQGTSSIMTSQCPTEARVTFLELRFADDTAVSRISPGWIVPPALEVVPDNFDVPLRLAEASVLVVHARLESNGRINRLGPCAKDTANSEFISLLKPVVSLWEFSPATVDGRPVTAELTLVLRFSHEKDIGRLYFEPPTEGLERFPHVVVDIIRKESPVGGWEVLYGDRLIPTKSRKSSTRKVRIIP